MAKNKEKRLTPGQLKALPISISEARKLLGATQLSLSDDDVARKIFLLSGLGRILLSTLDLQK